MASTQSLDVTPSSQSTERTQPVRPGPAGFLARRPGVGLGLLLMGRLIFAILVVSVRTNGPLLAWD